ncbi:MAG TPA: DUF5683 domain-containing protein [Chitinophagaceae bacterium]|nr:DUF5683 domain-containing protein [Chitinophagaceae bacterium]
MIFKFIFPAAILFLFVIPVSGIAQDSLAKTETISSKKEKKKAQDKIDTTINYPKIAATRSAILPGLGQIYNKKYWKLPFVYGGLGITALVFNYNLKNYKDLKQAYIGKFNARQNPPDSTEYFKINPKLLPLSEESLRFNRDQFRRNADYSVLIFAIIWGLNILDAAVDAHLKTFDVSEDLSLKIKPGHSSMAGTNGISLVLTIGK